MKIEEIELENIEPDLNQPRNINRKLHVTKGFHKTNLEKAYYPKLSKKRYKSGSFEVGEKKYRINELASNIRKNGLIQPIEVIELGNNKYKIIDGERRYWAFKILQKDKIPCIVKKKRQFVKDTIFIRQLVSDFQKEKLDYVEQAEAIRKLIQSGYTQKKISLLFGISRNSVSVLVKLDSFNSRTKEFIKKGVLSKTVIDKLANIGIDKNKEDEIIDEVVFRTKRGRKLGEPIKNLVRKHQDINWNMDNFVGDLNRSNKQIEIIYNYLNKNLGTNKDISLVNKNKIVNRVDSIRKLLDDISRMIGN